MCPFHLQNMFLICFQADIHVSFDENILYISFPVRAHLNPFEWDNYNLCKTF